MPEDLAGPLRTAIDRVAADVAPPPFDTLVARRTRRSRVAGGAAAAALAIAVAAIVTVPAVLSGSDERSASPGPAAPASAPPATSSSPGGTSSRTPDAPMLRVADVFDSSREYPGHRWTRNGESVPEVVIMSSAMPEHCDWQRATRLAVGWPLGSRMRGLHPNGRDYMRDPHGVLPNGQLRRDFSPRAHLPADARPTGFRTGHVELWLAPSDQDRFAYLVNVADHTDAERWPRDKDLLLCR